MTKEKFLSVRWNNILTLALGLPTLLYVVIALSGPLWTTRGGLVWLALIGVLYWIGIEFHTASRFAWLRKNSSDPESVNQAFIHPLALIRFAYNAVFWVFLLPFIFRIDYQIGFIAFAIVIGVRLVLNLVTNNLLDFTPDQYDLYPFRIPWIV